MLVREIMTKNPICCTPGERLDKVAVMMLEYDCGEIPICENGKLVGVITDRDIACRAVAHDKPLNTPVRDVMTRKPFTITADVHVDHALELMEEKQLRRLPVVNATGEILGIIAQADIVEKLPRKVDELLHAVSRKNRPLLV